MDKGKRNNKDKHSGEHSPACIDYILCSCRGGWDQWQRFALNTAPPNSINPCSFFFFLPRPYACLSPVLYSRVFSVMLYLTRGKMNAACVGREKWNHCTGIAVPECCNKQWICERWSGEYHFRGLGMRQWSVCAVRGLFLSVETRKTQSQSLFLFFHTHAQLVIL